MGATPIQSVQPPRGIPPVRAHVRERLWALVGQVMFTNFTKLIQTLQIYVYVSSAIGAKAT
jgi:hypothetical protein